MLRKIRKRILSFILIIILLCQGMDLCVLAESNEPKNQATQSEQRVSFKGQDSRQLNLASLNQEGLNNSSQISVHKLQGDMSSVFTNPYDNSSPNYDVAVYYLGYTQKNAGNLVDRSAMCLSYGAHATTDKNRCTYTQSIYSELCDQYGNYIITETKHEQLKGLAYSYEKIIHGTNYLEGLIDSEYEKLKEEIEQNSIAEYCLGTDGYNRLAYAMFQIAAWRVSCDSFSTTSRNNNTVQSYIQDTATVKTIVSQLFKREENDVVTKQAIAMYDYMKIMVYQSSGEYKSKYKTKFDKVELFYFRPNAIHPETEDWYEFQNIITWSINGADGYQIRLSKTGAITNLPVASAIYGIYADSAATKLLSTLTTNSDGEVTSNSKFAEGSYYIKEISSPTGYELDTKIYSISIISTNENIMNVQVSEKEIFNTSVTLYKYDSASKNSVGKKGLSGAVFEVQQYCAGIKQYASVGTLKDEGNGKYTLSGQNFKILKANGSDTGYTTTGKLFYTQQNEGKYKIVEKVAPAGYTVSDEEKVFTIKGENQEFIFNNDNAFYENGLEGTVKITKYDALTKAKLSGAKFELQEYNVNLGKWLTCGNLSEVKDDDGNGSGIYHLSDYVRYNYYASDGTTIAVAKSSNLVYTAYNKGKFRIVETESPNRYINTNLYKTVEFTISDVQKNFNFQYFGTEDILQKGGTNLGFYNSIRLVKYDGITKEKVNSGTSVFSIYEYIENQDKWYEVGVIKYNSATRDYTCFNQSFIFRNSNGLTISQEDMTAAGCQAGRLYYTSANKGKFKVVETVAPKNYSIGSIPYSKEFQILNTNGNGYEHDFTSTTNGARNIGISARAEVTKYDKYTIQKLSGATFTIYEYAVSKENYTRAVGNLVDSGNGSYTTTGGTYRIHAVNGSFTEFNGMLVYTTENQGKFRIVETVAPKGYTKENYEQYIQITTDGQKFTFNDYDTGAKDIPILGSVSLAKVDSDTKQKIAGATFEIQEYNNIQDKYIRIGYLKDNGTGDYICEGDYRYHGKDASVILTKTEDYLDLNGKLLVTSFNEGKFRIVETVAPTNYWIGKIPYMKAFTITSANKSFNFNTSFAWAENYPYYGTVSVSKQDARTKVYLFGAEFTLYEWNSKQEIYETLTTLKDQGNGYYTLDGVTVNQDVETTEGITTQTLTSKIRYTIKNQGKFKIAETKPPYSYLNYDNAGLIFSREFNINDDTDTSAVPISENLIDFQYHYETGAFNLPAKAEFSIIKKDSDTKDASCQGDATLEGAVYLLIPRENINTSDVSFNQGILYPAFENTEQLLKKLKLQETILNDSTGQFTQEEQTLAKEQAKVICNQLKKQSVVELVTKADDKGNSRACASNIHPGKYYLIEITAPKGYCLDDTLHTVDLLYTDTVTPVIKKEVTLTDTVKRQAFTFTKYRRNSEDTQELMPLEGAGFNVYQVSDLKKLKETGKDISAMSMNELEEYLSEIYQVPESPSDCKTYNFNEEIPVIKEFFSDKNGIVTCKELPYGTYVVTETYNPTDDSADIKPFIVTIQEDGQEVLKLEDEITITGERVYKQLESKTDEMLPTGELQILKTGDQLSEIDTVQYQINKKDCKGLTKNIDVKNKRFRYEQSPLEGVSFTISVAENIYLPDGRTDSEGNPKLRGYSNEDGIRIPLKKGAIVGTVITDFGGNAKLGNLPAGTYIVKETDTPVGFHKAEPFMVTIEDGNDAASEFKTVVNNRKKVGVSVLKKSEKDETKLSGAVYGLYVGEDIYIDGKKLVSKDELLELIVSDLAGNMQFNCDLLYGSFYIKEYQAPTGYQISDECYNFTITEESFKESDMLSFDHIFKDKEETKIQILKQSFTGGTDIKGAELQLLDSAGNEVAKWITDGLSKEIKGLEPGNYTLKETRTPFGYVVSESIEIKVKDTGKIQKFVMNDKEVMGCIEVIKIDGDTKEKLSGAVFEIKNKSGVVLDTLVTDKNGYAKSKKLFICTYNNSSGEYEDAINYYLTEITAPKGYTNDSTIHQYSFEYQDEYTPVVTIQRIIKNHFTPSTGDDTDTWKYKLFQILLSATFAIGCLYIIGRKKKSK